MRHARDGIAINVICPGFVKSPLIDGNAFPMPFLMDGDRAVRIIVKGLARNHGQIAFPCPCWPGQDCWAVCPIGWSTGS